jgi:hypothetical protein
VSVSDFGTEGIFSHVFVLVLYVVGRRGEITR